MEYKNIKDVPENFIKRTMEDMQSLQRREAEDFLRNLCVLDYPERQRSLWSRDYSSVEAFLTSVEPNRKRWREAVGEFQPKGDFDVERAPFLEDEDVVACWISVKFAGNLRCRAVFALPKNGNPPFPLVIAQHGLSSSPENVFGFLETVYHGFGYRLAKDGYAVLAPLNISGAKARARYTRMALLLGKTLFGLEVSKIKRLIDYVCTLPEVDNQHLGMWGISLGGAYTMFTLPLESRIKVGIICAFFNHRLKKMVIDDPRYSCFLSTEEEHIFIPGWLREFSDSDLVSLICPRPMLIQTGKADGVSWWPFVLEEFEATKSHYEQLGYPDRVQIDLHDGGHEIRYDTGVNFLRKWL